MSNPQAETFYLATRPPPPARRRTLDTEAVALFSRTKLVEEIGKIVRTAIVAGCAVAVAFYCSGMVHDLAGRTTAADIGIKFLGTLSISEGLAYAISVICVGFGYQRGRTAHDMAKRLARLSHLEQSIDPNRSSSHLGETGVPREEDR